MACIFSVYGNKCASEFTNADGLCETHAKHSCWCGKIAVEGCSHCGSLVCGAPLCKEHADLCPAHGGEKPKQKCSKCGQDLPEKKR